jgi:hypothetical protein
MFEEGKMKIICAACNQPLGDAKTASGSGGEIHYKCFKRGTMQGEEIDLLSLLDKITHLEKRTQDLEKELDRVAHEVAIQGWRA